MIMIMIMIDNRFQGTGENLGREMNNSNITLDQPTAFLSDSGGTACL
jgi:hypothetical protein